MDLPSSAAPDTWIAHQLQPLAKVAECVGVPPALVHAAVTMQVVIANELYLLHCRSDVGAAEAGKDRLQAPQLVHVISKALQLGSVH